MSIFNLPPIFQNSRVLYGTRVREYPLAYDQSHFLVRERRFIKRGYYTPTPLNTKNAVYTNAYLVSETPTDEQADGVWYEQVYATVPASIPDWTTTCAIYPGLAGFRPPQPPRSVLAKILRHYYLIGPQSWAHYESVAEAPHTAQTTLSAEGWVIGYVLGGNTVTLDNFTVTTGGAEPGVTVEDRTVGGWLFDTMSLSGVPNALSQYISLMAADTVDDSFSIVCEATVPTRYMGNIWQFDTIVTKAK